MNAFENVNTVDDLLSMNEERKLTAVEIVEEVMKSENAISTGSEVVMRLLVGAIEMHKHVLADKVEDEDSNHMDIVQWTHDLTMLKAAYDMLSEVKM